MIFILISEVETEWIVCRSYFMRYEVILQVQLSYFSLLKEITDTNFRPIHEDNRSLSNDADLKSKFKICKMDVNLVKL